MIVTVKIPYIRFKAWHSGKYYDEGYFEYEVDSNFFVQMKKKKQIIILICILKFYRNYAKKLEKISLLLLFQTILLDGHIYGFLKK